jgi:hypothetical protein
MKRPRELPKPSMFRRVFFALWGMATLILFVTVSLLVVEMSQRGQDPLAIVSETEPPPKPQLRTTDEAADYANIVLYFAAANGHNLTAERRSVRITTSTAENCKRALQELMTGPREELTAIVPPDTDVLAAFLLDDGELVINFTRDLRVKALSSASAEAMMIYGIVNTVCQPDLVGDDGKRVIAVRFLVEGEGQTDQFPAHFDLSEPIAPDPQWNASVAPVRAENV